jgi:uncharacterized protein YjbI with pentapeptide repeats
MLKKKVSSAVVECPTCGGALCTNEGLHHIFTASEKQRLFGLVVCRAELNLVDFSNANLRVAEFNCVSLVGADFSGADLRGASFLRCDLRDARFDGALFQLTRFDDSWLIGARGLSGPMREYVRQQGAHLWTS